jgi:cytoskeletal protein CcmA (bactofilin family)
MPSAFRNPKIYILLLASILLLSGCRAMDSYSSRIIFSGEHDLDGEIAAYGDLIILDGMVEVTQGSRITGSVYMISGEASINGEVDGNVTILDGSLNLGPNSIVRGNLNMGSSDVLLDPGSQIMGERIEGYSLPTEWVRQSPTFPQQVQSTVIQTVAMIVLALVLRRFLPRPLQRIELTIKDHPLISVTVGALSAVVGLVLFIQLAFTVILIPISIAGLGFMLLLVTVGWIALGGVLAKAVQLRLPDDTLQNVVYIFCISLVSVVIDAMGYVPLIGAPVVLLSAAVGIGSALLTRFGYQTYTPSEDRDLL